MANIALVPLVPIGSEVDFLSKGLSLAPSSPNDISTILLELWEPELSAEEYKRNPVSHDAYMQHIYCDLSRIACTGVNQISTFTHGQLLEICKLLRSSRATQDSVLQALGPPTPEKERLVRLAAGVLVPLNISGVGGSRPGKPVQWTLQQSLKDLVTGIFQTPPITHCVGSNARGVTPAPVQIPTSLNAYNLKYVAGYEIVWTSTLTDHLKVVEIDDSIKVYLYHQTSLLEHHLNLQDSVKQTQKQRHNQ